MPETKYQIGAGVEGRKGRAYTPEDEQGHRDIILYDSSTQNTYNSEGKSVDELLTALESEITESAEAATITEEITATLTSPIGDVKNGTQIPSGTTLTQLAKMMFEQTINPTYKNPTISLAGTGSTSVEIGTTINPTLTSTFTKNDAGNIVSHVINKNGSPVKTDTTASIEHTESIVMGSDAVVFKSQCQYEEGEIKNNNKGQPYPTGHVTAGTIQSSEKRYTSYRAFFYGALAAGSAEAPSDSAGVRALTNGGASSNGKTFTIKVLAGQQGACFAYPATLRDVTSVKYVEAGNDESKGLFTKTTVNVEGASGYEAVQYKVYTMSATQPYLADMTLNVTI